VLFVEERSQAPLDPIDFGNREVFGIETSACQRRHASTSGLFRMRHAPILVQVQADLEVLVLG